jgi:hypothetical protein
MITREFLTGILDDAGLDPEADARWDYSGRHMYGATCFGFVGRLHELASFFAQLGRAEVESDDHDEQSAAYNFSHALLTDNMGHDTIFYFPGVEVQDDSEDEGAD